jgi:hypothetical protein
MRRCGSIPYRRPSSPVLAFGGPSQPVGKRRLAFEGGNLCSAEILPQK